jgi:hypothetical protein
VQVQDVAAVTLQTGFYSIQQRMELMRTRSAVLEVQSMSLAMLLRRWERRFAQFLTEEQVREQREQQLEVLALPELPF